jgi:hypothetical protein
MVLPILGFRIPNWSLVRTPLLPSFFVLSPEWPVSEAKRVPDDFKGVCRAGGRACDKWVLLARKIAQSVQLFVHGAELLPPLVDAMRLIRYQSLNTAAEFYILP